MNGSVRGKEWRHGMLSLTVPYSLLVQIWSYRWWGNITVAIQIPASDEKFLLNKANWDWYEVLRAIIDHICSWSKPSRNIDSSINFYLCKCDVSPTLSICYFSLSFIINLPNSTYYFTVAPLILDIQNDLDAVCKINWKNLFLFIFFFFILPN